MFRNYFKTTFRHLWKNKAYSFLNMAGLAIGIVCSAFIFLWVEDEWTFNYHVANRNHLYRITVNQSNDGVISTSGSLPSPMAAAVKAEIPGIKNATRLSWSMSQLFVLGDKSLNETGIYADPALVNMFPLQFVSGNAENAFKPVNSVVISETMARKFFGQDDPVGKIVQANGQQNFSVDGAFTVTGVFKDIPRNATYRFEWLSPFELFENKNTWLNHWGNNLIETLVEVQPSADVASINQQLRGYLARKNPKNDDQCFLFAMNDWNLYNHFTNGKPDGGRIQYVKLFSLIAWIILLIACINFMNLSTARSEKRAKEVGIRKAVGAIKQALVVQFIGEALVMSFLAVLLAVGIMFITLPWFNSLVEKELSLRLFQPFHLGSLLAVGLFTGLIAGSYPAFYLSSFNPMMVLKGIRVKTSASAGFIRRGLVILQFSVSIVLIICTAIVYQQIHHVKERDLGYNKDNLLYLNLQGQLKNHFEAVRGQLLSTGVVENAALNEHLMMQLYSYGSGFGWQGKDPNREIVIHTNGVSPEFVSTMHLQLLEGRDFHTNPQVDSNNVLINESLAQLMGKEGKPGSIITANSIRLQVIGIIKDVVYNDMYESGSPMMLFCHPSGANVMTIRIKPGAELKTALGSIEKVMKANNPGYPFEYQFMDETFDQLFKTETLIGKLASVFAGLAIFISCLGLFGLAAYTAERRTKEIGIRKVLGATVVNIAGLLSKDFLQLVVLANLIAWPLAWWAMNRWLQDFAYRISVSWWVFVLAGITALLIALLTISFQAVKAAMANPVKSLRTE